MAEKPNWYGNWIKSPEAISALDSYYERSLALFMSSTAAEHNLADREAMCFKRFVETRLRNAAMCASSEAEAVSLIAAEYVNLADDAAKINRLIDDRESFPRERVIEIIVKLLEVIP